MRKSLTHYETIPVAVVRKIARPLPRRGGGPLSATRRLSLIVEAHVHHPVISRKGN